jgi:hypothetical protein
MSHSAYEFYEELIASMKARRKTWPAKDRDKWDHAIEPIQALLELNRWDRRELQARMAMIGRMIDEEDAEGVKILFAALDAIKYLDEAYRVGLMHMHDPD